MTTSKFFLIIFFILLPINVLALGFNNNDVELTENQVKVLKSLNSLENNQIKKQPQKTIRVNVIKLKDNQGQVYLGANVSRAELLPYLKRLEQLLGENFKQYRLFQASRDHQLFHMTLLSPPEYQLADKALIEKLLQPGVNNQFFNHLNVTLLGLGKVELDNKATYFVVAQSADAQVIRQQFLLKNKDFHVTLGFNPADIYGVIKDSSTLIE